MMRIILPVIGICLLYYLVKGYLKKRKYLKAVNEVEEVHDALEIQEINEALQKSKDKLKETE